MGKDAPAAQSKHETWSMPSMCAVSPNTSERDNRWPLISSLHSVSSTVFTFPYRKESINLEQTLPPAVTWTGRAESASKVAQVCKARH
jgi:hypothetical protein